jgi:Flp pilus assembly protein TadD
VYYKKSVYSRAVTYLQEASEKAPNNASVRYHLGMAYFKNGDKANARKELKKALELDPKFTGFEEAQKTLQSLG